MPETVFSIRWPDGTAEPCWSPSTVIREHFEVGASYGVDEFLVRTRAGLAAASDRVKARYGFGCQASALELQRIEEAAARFAGRPGEVTVEAMG